MGRYGKTLRAVVGEITRSSDRSPLFWWLVDHYEEIAQAAAGRRLQWTALCARFAEAGLTDLTGKTPTPNTAKVTWQRVKRQVILGRERQAAEAAKPKRVGAIPPSRIPRDWRPEEVVVGRGQPATPDAAARVPVTTDQTVGTGDTFEKQFQAWLRDHRINIPADASPHVWEQYRKAFAEFNHQDRFLRLST